MNREGKKIAELMKVEILKIMESNLVTLAPIQNSNGPGKKNILFEICFKY